MFTFASIDFANARRIDLYAGGSTTVDDTTVYCHGSGVIACSVRPCLARHWCVFQGNTLLSPWFETRQEAAAELRKLKSEGICP